MEINQFNDAIQPQKSPHELGQKPIYAGQEFSNVLGKYEEAVLANHNSESSWFKKEKEKSKRAEKTEEELEEDSLKQSYSRAMNTLRRAIESREKQDN